MYKFKLTLECAFRSIQQDVRNRNQNVVYLKYKDILKRILDVDLVNFIEPQVDGVTVEGTDSAVWFKVLLLDSIFVDCDARDVYWNKEAVVEATNIHWTKEEDLDSEEIVQFYKNKGKNNDILPVLDEWNFP